MVSGRIKKQIPKTNKLIFPRIGSICVGLKNDKGLPQSVDYFIARGKYAGLFHKVYGDRPQTIQIIFPDDEAQNVCNESYEYRNDAGERVAYGDGETFHVWDGMQYTALNVNEYPNLMGNVSKKYPNRRTRRGDNGWDITLTMTFIIPLIKGVAGVWTFVTKGAASTIPNIRDIFDAVLYERGFVRGIIWDMNVQFCISQKPDTHSRYPVVSIVPNESDENIQKIKESYKPFKLIDK